MNVLFTLYTGSSVWRSYRSLCKWVVRLHSSSPALGLLWSAISRSTFGTVRKSSSDCGGEEVAAGECSELLGGVATPGNWGFLLPPWPSMPRLLLGLGTFSRVACRGSLLGCTCVLLVVFSFSTAATDSMPLLVLGQNHVWATNKNESLQTYYRRFYCTNSC